MTCIPTITRRVDTYPPREHHTVICNVHGMIIAVPMDKEQAEKEWRDHVRHVKELGAHPWPGNCWFPSDYEAPEVVGQQTLALEVA